MSHIVDRHVLFDAIHAIELTALDVNLEHSATSARYVHHLYIARIGKLSPKYIQHFVFRFGRSLR